jgi:biotin carboxylase
LGQYFGMASELGVPAGAGTLLVVGGRLDTIEKARRLGLDVVLVQHKDHFASRSAELAKAVIIADYTDWEAVRPLLVGAHEAYRFSKVVTLTEPGLEPAGRINDMFGLGQNSHQVARLLKDKLAMRRHLAALGGPAAAASVAAAELTGEADLYAFGERHGYPFIVKPAAVTASVGVHRVTEPDQVAGVWQAVRALRARRDLQWGAFFDLGPHLVEAYVDGPEYSIEAFSFDGRHVVVAVTEKLTDPDGFLELGHAQPARLDEPSRIALVDCTTMFLDAVGLRQGASHTEIKLTADGPKVIEGHNRIGGDRIVDLLEAAYNVDFELLTVGWPFGRCEALPGPPAPVQAAATRFLVAEPGTVVELTGVDEVRAHPNVLALDVTVAPGSVIGHTSNWDRCGQIIAVERDTDAAVRLCEQLLDKICIHVDPATPARGAEERARS